MTTGYANEWTCPTCNRQIQGAEAAGDKCAHCSGWGDLADERDRIDEELKETQRDLAVADDQFREAEEEINRLKAELRVSHAAVLAMAKERGQAIADARHSRELLDYINRQEKRASEEALALVAKLKAQQATESAPETDTATGGPSA